MQNLFPTLSNKTQNWIPFKKLVYLKANYYFFLLKICIYMLVHKQLSLMIKM